MKISYGRRIGVSVLMLFATSAWSAPQYIQSPALKDVVKTSVGNVKSGTIQVPFITWGGDIRTIYGNGNQSITTSGSIFGQLGLKYRLVRKDVFKEQIEDYISGKSPYLRGTLGMINMAAAVTSKNAATKPVVIYQISESAGGDALVVKKGISNSQKLKGKTIAVQAYGPHVAYLTTVLSDAGLTMSDVKIKWLPDLTGSNNSPMAAFYESNVDAAMVIIPDALALTSGGNIGTGSEDSVKGASILLSTKTANKVIADVYAVRADYLKNNKSKVQKFVQGLMQSQEAVKKLFDNQSGNSSEYKTMLKASAKMLLDSEQATTDTEGLYADAEHVNYQGNIKFFTDKYYPRSFKKRNKSIQSEFSAMGLVKSKTVITSAKWDFSNLRKGLTQTKVQKVAHFKKDKVTKIVTKRQQQGTLGEGTLFSFEVYFKPNQKEFSADLYKDSFDRVIKLASTYGGAIITVEGHSDPLGYLKKKKAGSPNLVLRQIKQSAKNLSLTRAGTVRDNIISYAKQKHIQLDTSQFAVIGHGINSPQSGMCGAEPCAPKTKQEWLNNMRVQFRIIQIEAESDVFQPL
jgi:ABC-type nitrate/sulfonate/bicarbonate transport system substrate-binding protein